MREPSARQARSDTGTFCASCSVLAFSAENVRYAVMSLVSEAGSARSCSAWTRAAVRWRRPSAARRARRPAAVREPARGPAGRARREQRRVQREQQSGNHRNHWKSADYTNAAGAHEDVTGPQVGCALRAPTAFAARIENIRAANAVFNYGLDDPWFSIEIADCARMASSSVRNRRSARTASVRAILRCHG